MTNAQTPGERMAAEYFRRQTARTLADIHTLADWQARRATYRQQLLEMLGLAPLPPRGDLKVTLTGKVETEKFTVEKIHFQSLPGLYVRANLYLPKKRRLQALVRCRKTFFLRPLCSSLRSLIRHSPPYQRAQLIVNLSFVRSHIQLFRSRARAGQHIGIEVGRNPKVGPRGRA